MVSMFVNTCYGSFILGVCHVILAWLSDAYISPKIGVLTISPTFCVLQGR